MVRRVLMVWALVLACCVPSAHAQLGLLYTSFQPGQTISSAQFTANFTAISANACNRTGCVFTGTITFGTSNAYDIGSSTSKARDVYVGRNVDIDGTLTVDGTTTLDTLVLSTLSCTGCVTSTNVSDGTLVNADINSSAAIAYSKLALSGSIVNADINASAAIAYSKLSLSNAIVNADINSSAAIAYSKLSLSGSIVNSDISNSAAIAYSKLSLTGSIVNADVNSSAAIAYSKLNLSGSIVNADISASAAIADSKLAQITTANKVTEGAIADGSILARLAANESVTGSWSFADRITVAGGVPGIILSETDQTTNEKNWMWVASSKLLMLRAYDDAVSSSAGIITITRGTGTAISAVAITAGNTLDLQATSTTISGTTTTGGVIRGPNGSASAPTYSFSSSPTSGLYYSSGYVLLGNNSGTDRMYLGSNYWDVTLNNSVVLSLEATTFSIGRNLRPQTDNTYTNGTSGLRWSTVYAATGTINTSDIRKKKNIVTTSLGLDFVNALHPVEYEWKEGPFVNQKFYGFIAQDLLALGFEGVDTSNPDNYGLRYTELIAPMAKAIQELSDKVDALEARIAELEARP